MRSHVLLLTFLSIALSAHSLYSNPVPENSPPPVAIEFQRLFGDDLDNRFNKVIRVGDDYYVLGSDEPTEGITPHATLSRLNFQGQVQWTIRLGIPSTWNDIIETDEGNLLLVGGTAPYDANSNSLMGLATPSGSFLWVKYYNFSDREALTKVIRHPNPQNPDFPYYVVGVTQQQNSSTNDDINLFNINADGAFNWRKLIGNNADEEFYRDLEILSNGNLFLVGHAGSSAVSVQIDNTGSIVSGHSYSTGMRIYDAVERPGSGYYFVGSSSPSSPAQISRVNPNFQVVWSRTIPQLTFLNRVWIGPDNALYVMGYGSINGINRNLVIKFSETNNIPSIQWTKILDGGETAYTNGNMFLLEPDQIAYVDGRTGNPSGFGQSDAFLSISNLNLETCITTPGPTLSMSSFSLTANPYTVTGVDASTPIPQNMPLQGVAWQQTAVCGSSCEPVNTNTFSTILVPEGSSSEIELALDGFEASNGEHVVLGLSTAFSPFSLDLVFARLDGEGNLLDDPSHLDFTYNGGDLEVLIDSETQANAHMTEVFDANGNSQGYLLAATMFNTEFPPGGVSTLDVLTALIDHTGCVVWSRFMERPNTDELARDVLQLPNGDLLVLVKRYNPNNGENSMELLRYSINGQECEDLVFSLASTDDFYPFAVTNVQGMPNPTATVAVGGYWRSGQQYLGVYLLQSDLTMATPGPLLFDMLPANPEETPIPTGVVQSGQNLVLAGYLTKNSPDREAFLMSVRPFTPSGQVDGTVLWARRIRTNAANGAFGNGYRIYALDKNDEGDLFVGGAGIGSNDSFYRAFAMKTNSDGMVEWIKTFPGNFGAESADNSLAYDLNLATDGSLVLSGYRPRPDSSDGFFWVSRTDPGGNLSNCDCFDPLSLQVESYLPEFSTDTSPEPTPLACDGGLAIPSCTAFNPTQFFCDQFFPPPVCSAAFTWQSGDVCGNVEFTNQSTGTLPTYLWQFDDPLNSTSTEVNPTFTYYSSGTYNVCLTITTVDCTETYCEEITVEIQGAPAGLTCPSDTLVQVDPGSCENAGFQLPEAVVVDNCPCDNLLDVTYPPGYDGPYPVGQNIFMVTAVDACGFVTCEVTVTVDDGEAPVISCPADTTLDLSSPIDPSVTGEATATDPCSDVTITYADEVVFDNGCHITTERTWIATDAAGNADTCVQVIELVDPTPIEVSCPADIEVAADPGTCSALLGDVNVDISYSCDDTGSFEFGVTLTGATEGSELGTGLLFEPMLVGITNVEVWASDFPGLYASCSFTVTVTEDVPPVITCPDVVCALAAPGTNEAVVEFDDPLATDNCTDVTVICNPVSGTSFPVGPTSVVCTASDGSGNLAVCSFTVEVLAEELNAAFSADPVTTCGDVFTFTPAQIDPNLNYAWNFGDGETSNLSEPEHTFAGTGSYPVVLTVSTDSGCSAESTTTVDVVAPFIATFFYETDCQSAAFDGLPDDPAYTWSWDLPGGPLEGPVVSATFPGYGVYDVCATVSDGLCTQVICQPVELADLEVPALTCSDLSLSTDPGACTAVLSPETPEALDNCTDPMEIVLEAVRDDSLSLQDPWPLGTTCITWTGTDLAGNVGTCQQCITVADEEAPEISCPDDIVIEAAPGATNAVVEFGNAEAGDNCGNTIVSYSQDSGQGFPLGDTEVTCTATDDAGNSASCTFLIQVLPSSDSCCVDSLAFVANVNAGFSWSIDASCNLTVTPLQLNGCQQVLEWSWGDGNVTTGPFAGNAPVSYGFPEEGAYEVCMSVAEMDEGTGAICWEATYCETLSLSCGDPCALAELPVRTGYDLANDQLYGPSGVTDAYWLESTGLPMVTAPLVGNLPPLSNSNWIVPLVEAGYRNHEIDYHFCLPDGAFNCEDLVFDLGIQAWAMATIRINGRPVTGPLFLSPAYGGTGTWTFQPAAADCGLFRAGDNRLTIGLKTVVGGAGLNVSGSLSTLSGASLLGSPGCCDPAPACDCSDFVFNSVDIEPSTFFEGNPCLRAFRPVGIYECDEVEWYLNATLVASGTGSDWVYMDLPAGAGEVCLRVARTDLSGNSCGVIEKCWAFNSECGDATACEGGIVSNPGMEGVRGILGMDGSADPWLPAYGAPYLVSDPGAADPNFIVLSGNKSGGDAFYQVINPVVGQTYQLSFNTTRYLPARPGENTRLIVRVSDVPQTSNICTGTCQTLATIHDFSDTAWYHHLASWQPFSPSLKYLTVLVENDFQNNGTPASRSYIQIDNICLDLPNSTVDVPQQPFRIYPNPTSGELTVDFAVPASGSMQLTVFDLWGRPVARQDLAAGASRHTLDLRALPPAVYWVEVKDGGMVWREKVVVQ
ncbi:MAG: HYR domain-containing protein [Lewinellaceae bacterium]|nr:HYR domain-containing protein [Lewinellaceae bacterium]